MKQALLVFFLLSLSWTTYAYPPVDRVDTSTFWVLTACDDQDSKAAEGYCTGFIEASYNSVEDWCVPEDVSRGRLKDLIIAELRMLNVEAGERNSASDEIQKIIAIRWPCD